jgi:hypothetical protein
MTRLTYLIIALATIAALPLQAGPNDAGSVAITGEQLTGEQTEMLEGAVGLFVEAGLTLPSGLTVAFHQTSTPCGGSSAAGAFRPATGQITICSMHRDPVVAGARQRRVLVHELAHAWAESFLEPQRQEAFLAIRDVEAWRSPDLRWREQGTEQAADIVTWGIYDRDVLFLNIDNKSCQELDEAFRTLTGLMATAGLSHNCEG